jgi:NDP-sugar pyrophosphorylase family protein
MRAMILAAGLGTRLKPLTETVPKALIRVRNHTLLELQIKKLNAQGFDEIIINVHHFAEKIKEYLERKNYFNCSIIISDESNKLLDTGGGLKKASHFFSDDKPFVVCNVDIISNINLQKFMEVHISTSSLASLAIQDRASSRKFLFDNDTSLCGWMNEKTAEKIILRANAKELKPYAFSGIQIIDPRLFKYFPDKDTFSLIDLYLIAAKRESIFGYIHSNDTWMDLGKIENLKEAEKVFENFRNIYRV